MERGTDREFEVFHERWAELDRERALADRLVYGAALVGVGGLLLLLSLPGEACVHGGGVAGTACSAVERPPAVAAVLAVLGAASLVAGTWFCWSVVGEIRDRTVVLEVP
jgi:hypothetical protein